MKKATKEELIEIVKKLDDKLEEKEESFKVSLILMTALQVGANVDKIAKFLKIDKKEVEKYEDNLRKNKIWVGEKTRCDWFNKKSGGISFWCDVLVAEGLIERTYGRKNEKRRRKSVNTQ